MTTKFEMARRFAGDVRIAKYLTSTTIDPYRDMGHVESLEISAPDLTRITEKGMGRDDYGEDIWDVVTETSQSGSLTGKSVTRYNLAAALMGTEADDNQSAGADSATFRDVVTKHDMWSDLGYRKLDPANPPVIKDPTETTTYTEDTDYTIDYTWGWIKPLSTGSIPASETVKVDCTWLEITSGWKVTANTAQTQEYRLRLFGTDQNNGNYGMLEIPRLKFDMSGALAFLNKEDQVLEMSMTLLKYSTDALWTFREYS